MSKRIPSKRLEPSKNTLRSDRTDKTRYANWEEFYKKYPKKKLGETIKNQMEFLHSRGLKFTIDSPSNFQILCNESSLSDLLGKVLDLDSFRNHRGNWNFITARGERFTIRFNQRLQDQSERIHTFESLKRDLEALA